MESLTHSVESDEVPPYTVLCEIPFLPNLKPINVEQMDPETGGAEPDNPTGAGMLNDTALVIKDIKFNEAVNDNFGPEPTLDLETMAESDTHTWLSVADDS